jgi:hypothetical protein
MVSCIGAFECRLGVADLSCKTVFYEDKHERTIEGIVEKLADYVKENEAENEK